jgi:phosphopentomutase
MGVGELPDAAEYGDEESNTLGNIARAVGGLDLPHFESLGLGNITPIKGIKPVPYCQAAWGKMAEMSCGKDTTTGHWELMGLVTEQPVKVKPVLTGGYLLPAYQFPGLASDAFLFFQCRLYAQKAPGGRKS